MMFNSFKINVSNRLTLIQKSMIEREHYSGTARSQKEKYIFELTNMDTGQVLGLAIFGQCVSRNAENCYGKNIIELRKLVIMDAPKNTATWLLSRCLRYLKDQNISAVLSYSDPNQGHVGTIYKAANFQYLGKERSTNPRILMYKKEKYSIREVYQKTKDGKYTKKSQELLTAIKNGKAKMIKQLKKDIFLYKL